MSTEQSTGGRRKAGLGTQRARVLIVEDHPLVQEGLRARINDQADFEVCGVADDVDEALQLAEKAHPDIMIVDLTLKSGNGLDLIKRLRAHGHRARILVVSAHDERVFAERALRSGAQGFLNKQELQGNVIDALRTLRAGELFLTSAATQRLAGLVAAGSGPLGGVEALSDRELQVFQMIGQGYGTRSIAERLHVSPHTIESHRERIRLKLQLESGTELIQRAVQWVLEQPA